MKKKHEALIKRLVRVGFQQRLLDSKLTTFDGHELTVREVNQGAARWVKTSDGTEELRRWKKQVKPKSQRPLCGAKTRSGKPCRARVCVKSSGKLAKRCRVHGGLSTGPKSLRPCPKADPDTKLTILELLVAGKSIEKACKAAGIARNTFYLWQIRDKEFGDLVLEIQETHRIRRLFGRLPAACRKAIKA